MPRIIVSVSNDLATDQRVQKVCQTLFEAGFDILLIGRLLPESLTVERPYKVKRMRLLFFKGFLFYAELNIRLFFTLLWARKDILLANDLDTLLPNYLIAQLFRKKLIYDSHEYFTEVPELTHRRLVKKIWLMIEKWIFPQLKNVITVNDEIAQIYQKKYGVPVHVIRNVSPKLSICAPSDDFVSQVKGQNKMLLMQGAGINKDRGAEEAIEMMPYLENTQLYIIGGGDMIVGLKQKVKEMELNHKVKILGKLPYAELLKYTQIADLGLSLDKGTNLNYEYSLPNKIFDYIQCGIPLVVSNRKLVAHLVETHQIGVVLKDYNALQMAAVVQKALLDVQQYAGWKTNIKKAAERYNWENESIKLREIYQNLA